MVSVSRPLADFSNPRVGLMQCYHMKYTGYNLNDGQYRTYGIFDENIGNIQNLFYSMGNSNLKMTVVLYLWAVGKRMA